MLLKTNLVLLLCATWLAGCSNANNLSVLATTPKAAFVGMKQAHLALLRALTLADSDLGKAITAIENFSAAARKASGAVSELKGMM